MQFIFQKLFYLNGNFVCNNLIELYLKKIRF